MNGMENGTETETRQGVPAIILFDCDGTLVDSQVMITGAMTRAFEVNGLEPPSREATLSIVGLSLPVAIERLVADRPETADIEALVASYRAEFSAQRLSTHPLEPLYDGARAALAALSARPDTLLGIVTGKSRRGVEVILSGHGLGDHFHAIRTADDGPSKPHPFMVVDAVAELGGDVARTVVVGDTSFDMEMARAAGARALGVAWGYHDRGRLAAAGAEAIADRFADVPALVAALLGEPSR